MQSKIHTLDRRALMTGTAATAAAMAASTLPAPAAESIHDKLDRIAEEMAVALDEWIDGWHVPHAGYPRPIWHAAIYPASSDGGFSMRQDRPDESPLEEARRHLHLAAEAMNRNTPGKYRVELSPDLRFAVIIDDEWTKPRI